MCVLQIFSPNLRLFLTSFLRHNWYAWTFTYLKLQLIGFDTGIHLRNHYYKEMGISITLQRFFRSLLNASFLPFFVLIQILTWHSIFFFYLKSFLLHFFFVVWVYWQRILEIFVYLKQSLFHLQFLKMFFWVENWHFFLSAFYHILFHFLLIRVISNEKSAVVLTYLYSFMCKVSFFSECF